VLGMSCSSCRTILAGLAGGVALNLTMLLTFRLLGFGLNGGGILLDPALQGPKVIAVWTQIEPIPLVVSDPLLIGMGLILFGVFHAFVYRWLAPAWPYGILERTWRLAALVFGLSFLFWEFFTPLNMFGEPLSLIGLELVFWAAIALVEAFVISAISERGTIAGAGE
jgi:hypothetical protein